MATEASTFVLDAEFAFVGPMGFDIGAFLGNLFLAYFATDGRETASGERAQQRAFLLDAGRSCSVSTCAALSRSLPSPRLCSRQHLAAL